MDRLALTRLRELVEEGSKSSKTEHQRFWKQAPGNATSESKRALSTEGQRTGHTQDRIGAGGRAGSVFKARVLERETPPGEWDFAWRGDVYRRVNCPFSHLLAAGTAPSVAVQQQQLQATTATSTSAAAAAADPAAPADAVSGDCHRWGRGSRRSGQILPAAERRTLEQKQRGRRSGRGFRRGRSGPKDRQQLAVRALPSGKADGRGRRGK